jgi:hypothetical protein
MFKKLFGASFEASQNITPNVFSEERPIMYSLGEYDSTKVFSKVKVLVGVVFFSLMMSIFGIFLPESIPTLPVSERSLEYITQEMIQSVGYFVFVKYILVPVLFMFCLLAVLNLFPKKDIARQRLFGLSNMILLSLALILILMPIMLGFGLGASGVLGFSIMSITGIVFVGFEVRRKLGKIIQAFDGEEITIDWNNWQENLDEVFDVGANACVRTIKIWFAPLVVVIINLLTLRLGVGEAFSDWNYISILLVPLYFAIVALTICGPLTVYISGFYLTKYAAQYRTLWQISDEQWYGKRKARKMSIQVERMKEK